MTTTTLHKERAREEHEMTTLGFWIYIMTDCVLFACLFAAYAVLQNNTFGGPTARELFSLPFVLTETLILLTSSFTAGLAMLFANQGKKGRTLLALLPTLLLGIAFVTLEITEFAQLAGEGNSWQESGFLSSFFGLVGTHGLHVTLGSLWMLVLMVQMFLRGLTATSLRRLACFSLFWHFLDIVWIFIFTSVYLLAYTT